MKDSISDLVSLAERDEEEWVRVMSAIIEPFQKVYCRLSILYHVADSWQGVLAPNASAHSEAFQTTFDQLQDLGTTLTNCAMADANLLVKKSTLRFHPMEYAYISETLLKSDAFPGEHRDNTSFWSHSYRSVTPTQAWEGSTVFQQSPCSQNEALSIYQNVVLLSL